MGKKITFLHTGDLHIGAPIRGLMSLDELWSDRMRHAIMESFERLIRTAINRNVDFVVIAGDSFDTTRASFDDYQQFFDGIQKLHEAHIPTYLVAGNHDPYTMWAKDLDLLPPSAHFLGIDGPQFTYFEKDGEPLCLLAGRSYFNQSWPTDKDIAEGISRRACEEALREENPASVDAPFAIGIIHTGLDFDPNKAPAKEADLLARGMDYWACGHLHKQLIRPSLQDPRIVFPGCIQGRSINETGPHGAFVVTLEEDKTPVLEFLPTASVVLEKLESDVSECATLSDVARHIQSQFFELNAISHCENMIVRVTMTGQSSLYEYFSQERVLEQIRKELCDAYPSFYCDALLSHVRSLVNSDIAQEGTLISLVHSIAQDQRHRPEEMVNYVQSEFVKYDIAVPLALTRRVDEFEQAAESLVQHLLEEDA